MGLLSKLLGGDKNAESAEKAAKDLLNGLFGNAQAGHPTVAKQEMPFSSQPQQMQSSAPSGASAEDQYDSIPAEENQYTYNGTYEQYFEHVFAEDFPACRFEKSYIDDYGKHRVIYTFFNGAAISLVVELMPESSEAAKLRSDCIKSGTPYLRFYYDHKGWWNTRSYVVGRMRGFLNG